MLLPPRDQIGGRVMREGFLGGAGLFSGNGWFSETDVGARCASPGGAIPAGGIELNRHS